jgi:hypothetical protein
MSADFLGAVMERPKKGGAPKGSRTWHERKGTFQTIAVFRDIARMCAAVARDEGMSVAELTEPLLRGPLQAKYKKILERELKQMGGSPE